MSGHTSIGRTWWFVFMIAASTEVPASAQTPESAWRWSVAPFLWLSNLEGLSVVGDRQTVVGDSVLTPAIEVRIEAQKRRLGFRVLAAWAAIGNPSIITSVTQPTQGTPGRYDFSWTTLDAHGTLQVGPYDPESSFAVYGGVRFVRQGQRLRQQGGSDVAVTQIWVEPVGGTRYAVNVGRRVGVTITGDIGGFAVGSDFTWTLSGELTFRVVPRLDFAMRYMYREVEYDNKEEGLKTYRWDSGVQQGWFFGAVVTVPPR